MEYIDTFLYHANQYIDPNLNYFVLLSFLLIVLVLYRILVSVMGKRAKLSRHRKNAIAARRQKQTEQARPIDDVWMNAHDVDKDRFEKTIRLKNKGLV